MSTYAIASAASFLFVFLKSFQQLNVVHSKFAMVFPTSMLMAACEAVVIVSIARQGWGWIVLATGSGAGIGCISAMLLHSRLRGKS